MDSTKGKVISGLIWKFSERISAQLVTFIVSIVLARLLDPSHYGAIAIVNVFIALANVFVASGFGNSLIQKKDSDNLDYSSVFYANIIISIILYFVLFVSAPFIAEFYKMDILSPTLRVLGVRLIVGGVNSVQHAYVSKNMMFKRFFWSTLFGTLLSGVVGIILAYKGFGIWALVAQYMTNTTVDTLVLWFTVKWRPVFAFSFNRLSTLFSYGWKLLVSAFLDTGYKELRTIIIGKMYSSADLAYYNKGKSFPDLVVTNINSSIQSVLFPALSNEQDSKNAIKSMTRRSIRTSTFLMLPIMAGLALIATPLIKHLLTEKWLFCVPYLQISCITFAFMPIHTANLQAIKAIGRSDIFLKLEVIKKTIGILVLIAVMKYGVMAIAISGVFTTILSAFINATPNRKLLSYSYKEQINDMLSCIFPLLLMSISVFLIGLIELNSLVLIFIQIFVGVSIYTSVSFLTKNESLNYIVDILKNLRKKQGGK